MLLMFCNNATDSKADKLEVRSIMILPLTKYHWKQWRHIRTFTIPNKIRCQLTLHVTSDWNPDSVQHWVRPDDFGRLQRLHVRRRGEEMHPWVVQRGSYASQCLNCRHLQSYLSSVLACSSYAVRKLVLLDMKYILPNWNASAYCVKRINGNAALSGRKAQSQSFA